MKRLKRAPPLCLYLKAQVNVAWKSNPSRRFLIRAVIRKPHVYVEILLLQKRDDLLKRIAVFARYAHEIAVDRSLHSEFGVLDVLHYVARLFDGDALLKRD